MNYRLLERERKSAEMYKRTDTEDPDQDKEQKASEELVDKSEKDEQPVQRETNI